MSNENPEHDRLHDAFTAGVTFRRHLDRIARDVGRSVEPTVMVSAQRLRPWVQDVARCIAAELQSEASRPGPALALRASIPGTEDLLPAALRPDSAPVQRRAAGFGAPR